MDVDVRDNREKHRYELFVDGDRVGQLAYRERDGALVLIHTEVAEELEGQGLGTRLVADALADVRDRGVRVVPVCKFVVAYLDEHPADRDLVVDAP